MYAQYVLELRAIIIWLVSVQYVLDPRVIIIWLVSIQTVHDPQVILARMVCDQSVLDSRVIVVWLMSAQSVPGPIPTRFASGLTVNTLALKFIGVFACLGQFRTQLYLTGHFNMITKKPDTLHRT